MASMTISCIKPNVLTEMQRDLNIRYTDCMKLCEAVLESFHFLAEACNLKVTGMEAVEPVVACVILWPCIFGFIGVWRTLRSMCQLQLAHAALERGVCLTQPASAHVFDLFMALGMLGPPLDMKETY